MARQHVKGHSMPRMYTALKLHKIN